VTPRRSFIAASAVGIVSAASALTFDRTPSPKPGYAPVNGLKLYYEIHGSGNPLMLLHGGLGASEMFAEILPELVFELLGGGQKGRRPGWSKNLNRPARYIAPPDASQHFFLAGAGIYSHAIPRQTRARSQVRQSNTRMEKSS